MNIALIALSRPLSLFFPSSFSLTSLTTNCLAFTTPPPTTSAPIAGHFSPSISSFFFSSDASGGHTFTRESGGDGGGVAVYLSNNHHHGAENRDMGVWGGRFGGAEAAGGYGTEMVGGVGGGSE